VPDSGSACEARKRPRPTARCIGVEAEEWWSAGSTEEAVVGRDWSDCVASGAGKTGIGIAGSESDSSSMTQLLSDTKESDSGIPKSAPDGQI
jgi:hypothetical protein